LSKDITRRQFGPADDRVSGPFSCLKDLLAHYARTTPDRSAILAAGRSPLTYGALWDQTKETIRALRSLRVSQGDRVAVVLPTGPEGAAAHPAAGRP